MLTGGELNGNSIEAVTENAKELGGEDDGGRELPVLTMVKDRRGSRRKGEDDGDSRAELEGSAEEQRSSSLQDVSDDEDGGHDTLKVPIITHYTRKTES